MGDEVTVLSDDDWPALAASWADLGIDPGGRTPDAIAGELRRVVNTNPAGHGSWFGVRDGDRYIAMASYTPKTLCHGVDRVVVAEIGSTYTAPAAQGRGLFTKLVRAAVDHATERGVAALYGTPNETSGQIYLSKLGWTALWHWDRWLRPGGMPLRAAADVAAVVMNKGRGLRSAGSFVYDHEPAAAAPIEPPAIPHIERSKEYLAWRYPTPRYASGRLVGSGGETVAGAIATLTRRRDRATVALADLTWTPRGGATVPALLRHLHASGFPADYAMAMTGPNNLHDALRDAAFVRRPSPMPLIAHAAAEADAVDLLRRMHFVAGDSDTV